MTTLSPPDMQQSGVVSTRLARDESGWTTRKVEENEETDTRAGSLARN